MRLGRDEVRQERAEAKQADVVWMTQAMACLCGENSSHMMLYTVDSGSASFEHTRQERDGVRQDRAETRQWCV